MTFIQKTDDPLTGKIIGAAVEVHRRLGPGLLESTDETCLCYELNLLGLKVARQIPVPIFFVIKSWIQAIGST